MQDVKIRKFGIAAFIIALGALASASAAADDVNWWDGQWHFAATAYGWVPWLSPTINIPEIAGGGTSTSDIQPSQYFKYIQGAILLDGAVQKGDWGLWTDLVYLHLADNRAQTREISPPGGVPEATLDRSIDVGVRTAIWTIAPTYTVVHNDVGSLDVLAGLRYSSFRLSLAYQLALVNGPTILGGGFWPVRDSTDGVIGVKGRLNLSSDGRWYIPYLLDVGDGNKNWQWEGFVAAGYHFNWGDITLGVRNLDYRASDNQVIFNRLRFTGPTLGATFRW
jgi:hypothetical protein